jgi:hypothetical protein
MADKTELLQTAFNLIVLEPPHGDPTNGLTQSSSPEATDVPGSTDSSLPDSSSSTPNDQRASVSPRTRPFARI